MSSSQTTPGLFFTLKNDLGHRIENFAVCDNIALLKIGSATFRRDIYSAPMEAGQKVDYCMASAGEDGNGEIFLIYPDSQDKVSFLIKIKPDEVVSLPKEWKRKTPVVSGDLYKVG